MNKTEAIEEIIRYLEQIPIRLRTIAEKRILNIAYSSRTRVKKKESVT